MFITLFLRLIQARFGTSVSLKLALVRDDKHYNYRIRLPTDASAEEDKHVPVYA